MLYTNLDACRQTAGLWASVTFRYILACLTQLLESVAQRQVELPRVWGPFGFWVRGDACQDLLENRPEDLRENTLLRDFVEGEDLVAGSRLRCLNPATAITHPVATHTRAVEHGGRTKIRG